MINQFRKNFLLLLTGTGVAQAIPVLISPFLTRIYEPTQFGLLAQYMSYAAVLSSIATLRLEMAVPLPKKTNNAISIFQMGILISLFYALIVMVCIFSWNLFGQSLNHFEYLPISIFSFALFQLYSYWFNRQNKYRITAFARLTQGATYGALSIILGLSISEKSSLLIYSFIGGQIAAVIPFAFSSQSQFTKKLLSRKTAYFIALWKKYVEFPLYNAPHALLNILSSNLPILIFSEFFSETAVGYYSLSFRVIFTPVSLLSYSLSQVYYQEFAKEYNSGNSISSKVKKHFFRLLLASLIPLISFPFFAEDLFGVLFGLEWQRSGYLAALLLPWVASVFIVSPLAHIPYIFTKQKTALKFEILQLVLRIISLVIGAVMGSIELAIMIFSASGVLYNSIYGYWIYSITKK